MDEIKNNKKEDENNRLFREKSLERISSPEDLNDYVRVANPGIWLILIATALLLMGFVVWACFAQLETTVPAIIDSQEGQVNCFVSEKYMSKGNISIGMKVECGENEYTIIEMDGQALEARAVLSDYERHLGGFENGEWVQALQLEEAVPEGAYSANVIIDSVSPISFIFNREQ